jgi:hypothetical protein
MAGLKTIQRGGSRFYVHPETRAKYPGVTSVIDQLPKQFLTFWYAKMTAEAAADNIGAVVQMLINGERKAAIDFMKGAARRYTGEAADMGTEVHDLFERLARGERVGRLHPEVEKYANHIREFLDQVQPEFLHIEDTVWSDAHEYAGSFDWIARIGDEIVMGDTKTTRSGIKPPVALQLAAYTFADHIITQSGAKVDLPKIDAAAVFHARPEGWSLTPVRADRKVFDYFLKLRAVFDWEKVESETVIGQPVAGTEISTTGSQRRASR